ncbi:hypothetical protein ACT29H_01410 [Thermophagus sp. OGC60D27]|uniref:hypothetical protein n=1 Tax=Thermophagus sp. OGC60D27 TaxID=3458415 RepID=UPI004037E3D3
MKTSAIVSMIILALTMNLNAATPQTGETLLSIKHKATLFASLRNIEENTKKISAWMLNEKNFEPGVKKMESNRVMPAAFITVEKSRSIEKWMLNDALFSDYEEATPIEEWMFNDSLFSDSEKQVTIKNWMLDVNSFRTQK